MLFLSMYTFILLTMRFKYLTVYVDSVTLTAAQKELNEARIELTYTYTHTQTAKPRRRQSRDILKLYRLPVGPTLWFANALIWGWAEHRHVYFNLKLIPLSAFIRPRVTIHWLPKLETRFDKCVMSTLNAQIHMKVSVWQPIIVSNVTLYWL